MRQRRPTILRHSDTLDGVTAGSILFRFDLGALSGLELCDRPRASLTTQAFPTAKLRDFNAVKRNVALHTIGGERYVVVHGPPDSWAKVVR